MKKPGPRPHLYVPPLKNSISPKKKKKKKTGSIPVFFFLILIIFFCQKKNVLVSWKSNHVTPLHTEKIIQIYKLICRGTLILQASQTDRQTDICCSMIAISGAGETDRQTYTKVNCRATLTELKTKKKFHLQWDVPFLVRFFFFHFSVSRFHYILSCLCILLLNTVTL